MNDSIPTFHINDRKPYHDCELYFCFDYVNKQTGFQVDNTQTYLMHTTIKEVELLNEALNIYQAKGFKDKVLDFQSGSGGDESLDVFQKQYEHVLKLSRSLKELCQDEDSLIQLSEYCLETPPTYEDDFKINKHIRSVTVEGEKIKVRDCDDLKVYITRLKEKRISLFQ